MEEAKYNLKLSVYVLCKILHCFDFLWLFVNFLCGCVKDTQLLKNSLFGASKGNVLELRVPKCRS